MCVMHGAQERRTPGNALAVSADKPFRGLSQFGTGFLSKLECKSFTGSVPPFPCYARCNCVFEPSAGEEGPDGRERAREGDGSVGYSTVLMWGVFLGFVEEMPFLPPPCSFW